MSPNEAPSPDGFDPTDAKIDSLLRDFFRAEVPATLPPTPADAPDDWTSLYPAEAQPVASNWKWDFAAPALLAFRIHGMSEVQPSSSINWMPATGSFRHT